MSALTPVGLVLLLLACAPEQQAAPAPSTTAEAGGGAMEVSRSEARQPGRGPADWFTGTATITPLFDPKPGSPVGAALVRFEPGARTA